MRRSIIDLVFEQYRYHISIKYLHHILPIINKEDIHVQRVVVHQYIHKRCCRVAGRLKDIDASIYCSQCGEDVGAKEVGVFMLNVKFVPFRHIIIYYF